MEDIRETPIFKNYINWETNTMILHRHTKSLNRNLDIFIKYLDTTQDINKVSLYTLGNKYCLHKERIRQIYTKYLLRFILYIYYICKPTYNENSNDVFSTSINLLSNMDRKRLLQHFIDSKPFKHIGPKDLYLIKKTCKIL